MPVFGKNMDNQFNHSDPTLKPYAQQFARVAKDICTECTLDYFSEPLSVCMREEAYGSLRDFFVNESCDRDSLTTEEYADHVAMMEQLFENDRNGVINESGVGNLALYNPIIGMAFPMHKFLLMSNVFDNGGISKSVANTPKFTITMENRIMITPDGEEIDLFYDQEKIKDAFDATVPFKVIEMQLPEQGTTDLIQAIGAGSQDNIAIESHISAIKVAVITQPAVYNPDGQSVQTPAQTEDVWINVKYEFTPYYGDGDKRYINQSIRIDNNVTDKHHKDAPPVVDYLSGMMHKNQLVMQTNGGNIKAVRFTARKDTSNGLVNTPKVDWKQHSKLVEIGTAIPINIPISPEIVKDVQALYGENQLSKLMSIVKDVMGNHKDDTIKQHLDQSFMTMDKRQRFTDKVNFAVNGSYTISDPVTWRHSIFMDKLDSMATDMIQVWNDPNVDVTVIGRTDLIRKILPGDIKYMTEAPGNIGPVALGFKKNIYTTDNRRYEFISTDKIRTSRNTGYWSGNGNNPNDLIILLKPRGTDRIMYMVYDYQLYIANDIRNAANPTLPAIHSFDRWKFEEYQPVQGRLEVLNPSGFVA